MVRLSSADLDDFIRPSQACVKPIVTSSNAQNLEVSNKFGLHVAKEGEHSTKSSVRIATVSLSDCLACSGCVTSAETVLVEQQSLNEVQSTLQRMSRLRPPNPDTGEFATTESGRDDDIQLARAAASISPQTRASFAALWNVSIETAHRRLCEFLRHVGFDICIDTNYARSMALRLAELEFYVSYAKGQHSRSRTYSDRFNQVLAEAHEFRLKPCQLPVLCSACPGWICYAEKMQHDVLQNISCVRSPQQIAGRIIKQLFCGNNRQISGGQIFHVAVMPCSDKKLEASRVEYSTDGIHDVDCVLTTHEVLEWMQELDIQPGTIDEWLQSSSGRQDHIDSMFDYLSDLSMPTVVEHDGSSSGGYAYHILRSAGRNIFGIEEIELGRNLLVKSEMNSDLVSYTLLGADQEPVLRVATCYGFRNIQNLVRRLKTGSEKQVNARARRYREIDNLKDFDWIEVMACPSGCINGGGQIKVQDVLALKREEQLANVRAWIEAMERKYREHQGGKVLSVEQLTHVFERLGSTGQLMTAYKAVPKDDTNMLQLASVW